MILRVSHRRNTFILYVLNVFEIHFSYAMDVFETHFYFMDPAETSFENRECDKDVTKTYLEYYNNYLLIHLFS